MSELILNVETALPPPGTGGGGRKRGSEGGGSRKHQRFVRRRRFLERKGFLRQKQLPPPPAPALKEASRGPGRRKGRPRGPDGTLPPTTTGPAGGASSSSSSSGASVSNGAQQQQQSSPEGSPGEWESGVGLLAPSAPAKALKMVAIDCEMVGTGPGGRTSDLARCSVVSYQGEVVYDRYIRPLSPITNYRTRWSGIRRHHMAHAVPFKAAQKEILKLLSGKIVVGHAIHNDFKALKYFHPKSLTRDTSRIPLLNRKAGFPENESASLKRLTKQLLHRDIQVGQNGHSSVEDARATMELYKVIEVEWERHLASCPPQD